MQMSWKLTPVSAHGVRRKLFYVMIRKLLVVNLNLKKVVPENEI